MENSEYFRLSHNVSNLVYHIVCLVKYRRVVFDDTVEDHVHFLIQSLPTKSPTELVRVIKSVIASQIFKECPQVKKLLWGGEFWTDGYFVASMGRNQNETVIKEYVKNQDKQALNINRYILI